MLMHLRAQEVVSEIGLLFSGNSSFNVSIMGYLDSLLMRVTWIRGPTTDPLNIWGLVKKKKKHTKSGENKRPNNRPIHYICGLD